MRSVNLKPDGTMLEELTRRYEVTWINDLPYMHLLEIDDKPLTGDALRKEQKRYDDAIAKKKDLGQSTRTKTDGYKVTKPSPGYDIALSPTYRLHEISLETADGRVNHVIEARLVPNPEDKPRCLWRFMFWISDKDHALVHALIDTSEDTSEACQNTRFEESYAMVDGLTKPIYRSARFNMPWKKGYMHVQDYEGFTGYRRFQTDVTIHPGGPVEDKALPPENQPPK